MEKKEVPMAKVHLTLVQKASLVVFAAVLIYLILSFFSSVASQGTNGGMPDMESGMHTGSMHSMDNTDSTHAGTVGEINHSNFDPSVFLEEVNYDHHAKEERAKYYRETPLADGTKLREYWITAKDENIEVAPGVFYPAWTFNGQVPGPTIKAVEGDTIRIYFKNLGSHPHTMHFHGFHESEMDGAEPEQFINPGENFTYEFKATPVGTHLYHCHSTPLKKHIEKGLYGAFIIEPKSAQGYSDRIPPGYALSESENGSRVIDPNGRVLKNEAEVLAETAARPVKPIEGWKRADREWIMVLNAFDTNFDGENEIYAVNTEAFAYAKRPIKAKIGELVRIHVINVVENDPVNSLHIHANFFDVYPTGTLKNATAYTDIIELGQAERSMIEIRFKYPGRYMFHAHQTEFSEKGWMGFFEVEE